MQPTADPPRRRWYVAAFALWVGLSAYQAVHNQRERAGRLRDTNEIKASIEANTAAIADIRERIDNR